MNQNWKTECIHDGLQASDLRRVGFSRSEAVKYGLAIIIAIGIMVMSFASWAVWIY